MRCPSCNMEMRLAERQGIEIDYCPQCRGVWLDRGELDKIIERTAEAFSLDSEPTRDHRHAQVGKKKRYSDNDGPIERDHRHAHVGKKKHPHHDDDWDDDDRYERGQDPKRRKKNRVTDFFEEIFDIF